MAAAEMITIEYFSQWLEMYSRHSAENNAKASAELFAQDARYYENPFDEPLVGREAIYQYWKKGAENLEDKTSAFEILALSGNLGVARWRSFFRAIKTSKRFELDCIFAVEFDGAGKCINFREWWHSREQKES